MTFEGLGEMFEGDSADMFPRKISAHIDGGQSGGSCVRRPGSEDRHRRERNCAIISVSCVMMTKVSPV